MQTANKAWLPLGAKLTDAQYASLRAGNLYVTSIRRPIRAASRARNSNPDLPSSFQRT